MNLTQLKTYAPAARNAFIKAVTRRAGVLGIHPGRVDPVIESGDVALIGGQPFPRSIVPLRKKLVSLIDASGFEQTMESMAYTWFDRLVALRFMELHAGYLDHGYRVLSHPQGNSLPEILQHAEHVELKGLDHDEVVRLKLDGNRDEELYRLLLLVQCNQLHHIMPSVFSRLDDVTILLLPDNLLHSDSVIRQLVNGSDPADWERVEVLGWLYQFYISEKKDMVMARKSAVPTEDIPAVTQLFTPHWIVRYLVENSLGRLWLLNRPHSRLREHMPYYIEGEAESDFLKITRPEDIKFVDPACGSGHILAYAFDLLYLIYEEEGYAAEDIPGLILKHNLCGLEICPRAAQLAELTLVLKAREKSRRFFSEAKSVLPNIIELCDVRFEDGDLSEYFRALGRQPSALHPRLATLLHQFEEAKNFGSLIQPCLTDAEIQAVRLQIQNLKSNIQDSADLMVGATHLKVLRVLEQAEALTQRYHVVAANPPYMGGKGMNSSLKAWLPKGYPESKSDLMTCFMERCRHLSVDSGFWAMINLPSWMFIGTYSSLRSALVSTQSIKSLLHLGRGLFGPDFGTVAFVIQNRFPKNGETGIYRRLFEKQVSVRRPEEIEKLFLSSEYNRFLYIQSDFLAIDNAPIAYWVGSKTREVFKTGTRMEDIATPRQGLATGDNDRFLRYWQEINISSVNFSAESINEWFESSKKWAPYSKGGPLRKWYGNGEYLISFDRVNYELLSGLGNHLPSRHLYFRKAINWSLTSSSGFAARSRPAGYVFDVNGMSSFVDDYFDRILGLVNSSVGIHILKILNPTMAFQVGDIKAFPCFEITKTDCDTEIASAIAIARADWDNFETSWDFRDFPMLRDGSWEVEPGQPCGVWKARTLAESWNNYATYCNAAIRRMQDLETENNRLWIDAYGLQDELTPEVPEDEITLAHADARKDMAAFLSYAIGCMMGRYSPDHPGLILANAGDTLENYRSKIEYGGLRMEDVSFTPDADGIIPVLDGEWFDDDIVLRTREFLRVTFGEATLNENIRFVEDSLGRSLRDYFLGDFYKDHLQTYKNRPIYWLFSSGRHKAFQCLVYLHRYTPGTLARIRTEYVIPLQGRLGARIDRLKDDTEKSTASAARKKLQTEYDKAKQQMVELVAFDAQLRSYSDQSIALDLDDGVKVNYAKFGPLVADAKKVCGTKED